MIYTHRVIVAFMSASMLSACQTTPQKNIEKPDETNPRESELGMMPSTSGSKTKSSYQIKTMTQEELKSCAQNLYNIKKESALLNEQNASLEKRKTTLSETEQSLIDRRLKMDTRNAKLVKEFNQEGNKYFESVKQFQAEINGYNNQVNKTNRENNAYITNCTNRAYKISDLNQLAPNLIDVMQNNSKPLDVPLFEEVPLSTESNKSNKKGDSSAIHLPGSSGK